MEVFRIGSMRNVVCCLSVAASLAFADPDIALPFNSQVPLVARAGTRYSFQFSPSTFAATSSNLTYSLSNQPTWLSLDSATRTLSGAPSEADVGAAQFTLSAANIDGVAHMPCTLVISKDPAPQIQGDLGEQLASTTNLSATSPPALTVLPSSSFRFQVSRGSFIDIVQRQLYYYATLADHTPLPAWLLFDSQSLTFSGVTPQFASLPQSWNIAVIASDVAGFGGASASFTITIATQQLVFVPEQYFVDMTAGKPVNFTGLQEKLFRNGQNLAPAELKSTVATTPPWLRFEPSTFSLTGTAPSDVTDFNVTVTVDGKLGNRAAAVVYFATNSTSIFNGDIGALIAHAGQHFNYHFPDNLFTKANPDIQVVLPTTARWLVFDTVSRTLSGDAPLDGSLSTIQAKIVAGALGSSPRETQAFTIDIEPSIAGNPRHTSATGTAVATADTASPKNDSDSHLNSGVVAAVVLGCLLAAAILVACLVLLRRRKKIKAYVDSPSPHRRTISRPILQPDPDAITVTTELHRDIEKSADSEVIGRPYRQLEHAPQVTLDLPINPHGRRFKWSKRFSRISHTSSLGVGEDAIRADSNIPELGSRLRALCNPHESFSVPAEMARTSKQTKEVSGEGKERKRIRKKRRPSVQSIGLGIDTRGEDMLPRPVSQGARSYKRAASSSGLTASLHRRSVASFSTRGTSVLSTRPSDFPRPPTRSALDTSKKKPNIMLTDGEKRRSIRLVERSDSAADERSLREKRLSFIRNRASASLASPLFANGARVSSGAKQHGRASLNEHSLSGNRISRRGNSHLSTYSKSSSLEPPLEPPTRDPRRLSSRLRNAFAPNFPRAVTKSTIGDDDAGDWETSSVYSTTPPMSEKDYTSEMALERHQRTWVLPGEASPTPPPAPPTSRKGSSTRRTTPPPKVRQPQHKWRERLREHSWSPLSTARAVPIVDRHADPASAGTSQTKRNRLSEPMSLVSNDSLSRAKPERPRLVHTTSRRPVSIEKVKRLSSLRAESENARPGSEMFEALEGVGLLPPTAAEGKEASQRNISGPAFL